MEEELWFEQHSNDADVATQICIYRIGWVTFILCSEKSAPQRFFGFVGPLLRSYERSKTDEKPVIFGRWPLFSFVRKLD